MVEEYSGNMPINTNNLINYFVIIAYDEAHSNNCSSIGTIVQRFPQIDWPNISLSPSLGVFSQPQGWKLLTEPRSSSFFVNTLTDIVGSRQYACCLQIYEPYGNVGESEIDDAFSNSTNFYAPKTIMILSRFPFFDLFRRCLNQIYLALLDPKCDVESIVAKLISSVKINIDASPVTFMLDNERYVIGAPSSLTVPITSETVLLLTRHLGTIHNTIILLCAVMSDHKILFRSSSLSLLSDCCYALRSLLYPFEYLHTYVPVLPECLIEYVESPTPYIMGTLDSFQIRCSRELDAIIVDLDVGALHIPSSITIPCIPEPFLQRLIFSLQMVMFPSLALADDSWKSEKPSAPGNEIQDKRIRACFLRFFVDITRGYRCYLEAIRIYPAPLIVFHKSAFLGARNFSGLPLIRSFVDTVIFQAYISERGIPFRTCDLFDDLASSMSDENPSNSTIVDNVFYIAEKLMKNEYRDSSFINTPFMHGEQPTLSYNSGKLKTINDFKVTALINENLMISNPCNLHHSSQRKVPWPKCSKIEPQHMTAVSRRIQVLRDCLRSIFDLKLSEARKMLAAVELSLRSVGVRIAFCQILWSYSSRSQATLTPQQFELVARIINCALSQESKEDEHGIAYAMLHLSHMFSRRLSNGVHQFLYTCIQDHAVWDNECFWEAAFFHDMHRQLCRLYLPPADDSDCPFPLKENITNTWNLMERSSGLEWAGNVIAGSSNETNVLKKVSEESSIVYGQAKHYINLMVYLKVPLDVSKLRQVNVPDLEKQSSKKKSRSDVEWNELESDVESECNESDATDLGSCTVRWIGGLIDRICSAAGLEYSQRENLCFDIPGFVALHIDNLEQVHMESKRLSPMQKSELMKPTLLLPAEHILLGGLRSFLLKDRRLTYSSADSSRERLLPSEGAIYLTNYRVIFKGQPCDPFLSEKAVLRAMPIASIVKEKGIGDQYAQNSSLLDGIPIRIAHRLHDFYQLRSSTFQVFKVAFDEEVSTEKAEEFIETLLSLRWSEAYPHVLFAFCSLLPTAINSSSSRHKYLSISGLKRTLLRNPRREKQAHLAPHVLAENNSETMLATRSLACSIGERSRSRSEVTNHFGASSVVITSASSLHHHYMIDYDRLDMVGDTLRLSRANKSYYLAKGYPHALLVPVDVSDESLLKISKGFKHSRFPVVSWKSAEGVLLIRGANFATQTVASHFKKQTNWSSAIDGVNNSTISLVDSSSSSMTELQERYIAALASISYCRGIHDSRSLLTQSLESLLSIDSQLTIDSSSYKADVTGASKAYNHSNQTRYTINLKHGSVISSHQDCIGEHISNYRSHNAMNITPHHKTRSGNFTRCSLYIFGDPNQSKMPKFGRNCQLIPVTFPTVHKMKIAFKKFMRVLCPGWRVTADDQEFFKVLEETSWLQMISCIIAISNVIVELIDVQHSSVAVCLEDGWDATCQIMSIAQLLLDPYYRTFDGFRVLIEKEWLAFGHHFSYRANQSIPSQKSGIAPVFLMFLDSVHQIWEQFKSAFEFNDFFLRFVAYQSTSACYRTFLLDSEEDRLKFDTFTLSAGDPRSSSIWTSINEKRTNCSIFENFEYLPKEHAVLRPQSFIGSLHVWSFYSEDYLAHGAPYDVDVALMEFQLRDDERFATMAEVNNSSSQNLKRVIDAEYFCPQFISTDSFSSCLEDYLRLRSLCTDAKNQKRESLCNILDVTNTIEPSNTDFLDSLVKDIWRENLARVIRRTDVMKLLLRGLNQLRKSSRNKDSAKRIGHRFTNHRVIPGNICAVCYQNCPGSTVNAHKCLECGIISHENCLPLVTAPCVAAKVPRIGSTNYAKNYVPVSTTSQASEIVGCESETTRRQTNVTLAGYLMKRGATFRLWKSRWFVLDSCRRQLRYYGSDTDSSCKGIIDLNDVKSVDLATSHNFKCPLLEIKTSKRPYLLMSKTRNDAENWLEYILIALRD